MIIVSQDKKELIILNQIESLRVLEGCYDDMTNYHDRFSIVSYTSRRYFLGEYETEERAKEVLNEIILRYGSWENMKVGQPIGICAPVYYMPEE